MKIALKLATAVVVAAFVSGPAAAEWYAFGSYEPDTRYDTADWMWQDAPGTSTGRLYFSVISGVNVLVVTFGKPTVNPNVGLIHTRVENPAFEIQHGLLGVWVDCNGDGYVGLAESALREYSAAALVGTTTCPPATGAPNTWPAGAHNYNGWVVEFVPIVDDQTPGDARVYKDPEARVWGDFERPDQHPQTRNCPTRPWPRGTMETVGGMLNYIDCRVDILGPMNDVNRPIGDPLGIMFADENDAQSGSLGPRWLFGPEDSQHAAVRAVDCDDPALLTVGAVRVRAPSPSLGPAATNPAQFTLVGQVNQTKEEFADDCNASNDYGHDVYDVFEADFNSINPNNKTESNWNFNMQLVPRSNLPLIGGAAGAPPDMGQGFGGTHWLADSVYTKPGPRNVRYDLDAATVEFAPSYWMSFYAHVGQATFDRGFTRSGSGEGVYGQWACNGAENGIHNGWNCDDGIWYRNPDGSYPPALTLAKLAKPGWTFQFRDVDCYDGGLGDVPVGVEPAYYGNEPCAAFT